MILETTVQTDKKLAQFQGKKYLCLESYRRNGQSVRTPVWFLEDGETFYITTGVKRGKVKRIRHNREVKIVPCDMRGAPMGEWIPGRADLLQGDDAARAVKMMDKKYGFMAKVGRFYQWLIRRKELVIAITPSH